MVKEVKNRRLILVKRISEDT